MVAPVQEKPYALDAALTARELDKERARALLEEQRSALAQRQRELAQAQQAAAACSELRQACAGMRTVTGAELSRRGAEACRHALQHAELLQREDVAKRALAAQERRVQAAEMTLATTFAEHAVIEQHHAQFRAEQRKQDQARAGDEQDDVLAARAHSRITR